MKLPLLTVTLNDGCSRLSPRWEMNQKLFKQLKPLVVECEAAAQVDLPSPHGLIRLKRLGETHPPSAHVALWAVAEPSGHHFATLALATDTEEGGKLWRRLHRSFQEPKMFRTNPTWPPNDPWLAMILHSPARMPRMHPAVEWLWEAQLCIAWAWIDAKESTPSAC